MKSLLWGSPVFLPLESLLPKVSHGALDALGQLSCHAARAFPRAVRAGSMYCSWHMVFERFE